METWFIPSPINPMEPAWIADRLEMTGCRGGELLPEESIGERSAFLHITPLSGRQSISLIQPGHDFIGDHHPFRGQNHARSLPVGQFLFFQSADRFFA